MKPHLRWMERVGWLGAGMILASTIAVAAKPQATDTLYRKLQVLAEVMAHVENYYVDSISAHRMVYGAATGITRTLDPHSMFFDPDEYRGLVDTTEGEYAGIGVELGMRRDEIEIGAVLEGSPAHRAGLKTGDVLVEIDGHPLDTIALDALQRRIKGPVGSKVVVGIRRDGVKHVMKFTLVRGWVRISPVFHQPLPGNVQYVKITTFSRRVAKEVETVLERTSPKGLIMDLRNNPGGLFDEAVEICDLFLTEGPIVRSIGKGGQVIEEHNAKTRAGQAGYPVAILVDQGSASASEIVAGALQDRKVARLFGEKTFGKGSVQQIIDLSDGSGLKLTVARYLTPSGNPIDGRGIEPDVRTEPPRGDKDPTLFAALEWVSEAAEP